MCMALTGGYSDVDEILHVVRLALAQLLPVDPLRHKHTPCRVLGVVERHHYLRLRVSFYTDQQHERRGGGEGVG